MKRVIVQRSTSSAGGSQSRGRPCPLTWRDPSAARRTRSSAMPTAVVWFRRDLRVHDHPPLVAALPRARRVVPLFVLRPAADRRPLPLRQPHAWMLDCLRALDGELRERGGRLVVRVGRLEDVVPEVAAEAGAEAVYAAGDVYRLRARARRPGGRARRTTCALGPPGLFIADLPGSRPRTAGRTRSSRRSGAPGRARSAGRSRARRGDRAAARSRRRPSRRSARSASTAAPRPRGPPRPRARPRP